MRGPWWYVRGGADSYRVPCWLQCVHHRNLILATPAGDPQKPPVVLVHGFGASAYHWRYVVPELAKKYSVYAVDLLGFGMSSKPSVVYNGYTVWSDQLTAFIEQVGHFALV